jgi:hypothetical protein
MARIFRFHMTSRVAAATVPGTAAVAGAPNAADSQRRIAGAADQACDAPAAFIHPDRENLDPVAVHQGCRVSSRQH